MTAARAHPAGMAIPPSSKFPFKFIIVGGISDSSSEVYDGTSWAKNATLALPSGPRWGACLTMIDDATLILIGGMRKYRHGLQKVGLRSNLTVHFQKVVPRGAADRKHSC